ncbi:FecR family protein [Pontibacter mangrovi]|uniref:DUF4974 domain-containing protein n=1 Tax=Pontibacter mangrovi TaxID=2589816 RepID=A0A501W2R8_9BACT|nr:FecR domain-containing protein [Pontibacter mangrovi]TPE42374.1 DUF4974 domain-containing protein [Pontibacter mangrovi]
MDLNTHIPEEERWPAYLEAWFSGEADAETLAALQAWRKASPANERLFQAYQRALSPHPPVWAQQIDVNRSWEELLPRLTRKEAPAKSSRITWRVPAFAAAAVLALLLVGWWLMAPKVHRVQVADGKETIWLPDSSQVLLNAHSTLTYKEGFGKEHRSVTLEGQGFFQVRPDKRLPFRIESKAAVTQVVGTSFDLQAYPGQGQESLAVVTGTVQYQPLSPEGEPLGAPAIVQAGHSITFKKQAEEITLNALMPHDQLVWSGRLVFEQTRLDQVLRVLRKHYKREIVLQDPKAGQCLLTASFQEEKLTDVLDVIALSLRMTWQASGDSYILSGNGCNEDI